MKYWSLLILLFTVSMLYFSEQFKQAAQSRQYKEKYYKVLISDITYEKAITYLQSIKEGKAVCGAYLQQGLKNKDILQLSVEEFIELIVRTKRPQIFAESQVYGNGSDWNQSELSILGDISIAVPVIIYDNGIHYNPDVHKVPLNGTLLYTPGALLRNDKDNLPADWQEVTIDNKIFYKGYYSLYERRLLPPFIYADSIAKGNNKKALITIPGIGCGQFAGKFRGKLGELFKKVLIEFLNNHGTDFSNIRAIYYDPYNECCNERFEINGISFIVRPLTKNNDNRGQLCTPERYEVSNTDDFSNCELFSFVAWDHVSWPGNDFYIGSRLTDDGVKAAATNSMAVITGIEGFYNMETYKYSPPEEYRNWEDVVMKNKIQLQVINNLLVLPPSTENI